MIGYDLILVSCDSGTYLAKYGYNVHLNYQLDEIKKHGEYKSQGISREALPSFNV